MDYMRPSCLEHFTDGQSDRMKATIANSSTLAAFVSTSAIATVVQGATQFFCSSSTYTVNTSSGNTQWSSSNTSVATINASTGVATATGNGTVVFTATVSDACNTTSGSISVQVGTQASITGSYIYNSTMNTLQGTNFIQRNGNSVYVQVSLNPPYNFTYTCDNSSINVNGSGNTFSFSIPTSVSNGFKVYATTTDPGCTVSNYWIFVPTGYASYSATPNPANSELTVADGTNRSGTYATGPPASAATANSTAPIPEPFEAELYDMYGTKVRNQKSGQGKVIFDVHSLPDGLYNIRVGKGKNAYFNHIQIAH